MCLDNESNMSNRPILKTQFDAVIHFFSKMDADMISTLLDDDKTYQDFSKILFVRKLGDLFFEFSQLGDTFLVLDRGECYGCSCGVSGYSFVGNKSKSYVDIVFMRDENKKVTDIYECGEFFNKHSKIEKKNRLFLDKYVDFDVEDEEDYPDNGDPFFGDDDIPF